MCMLLACERVSSIHVVLPGLVGNAASDYIGKWKIIYELEPQVLLCPLATQTDFSLLLRKLLL